MAALVTLVSAMAGACSSSTATAPRGADAGAGGSGGGGGVCASPGGPVVSTPDAHCKQDDGGQVANPTSQASCHADAGTMGASAANYGSTLNNSEGDDDDCKYHVSFTVTPVCESSDVTFTATITNTTDGKPVTGADPNLDVFLSDLHLAPNTKQATKEKSPGVYTIGPVQFDKAGKWTVRFHIFETCSDALEDSPHGHVGFFIDVP